MIQALDHVFMTASYLILFFLTTINNLIVKFYLEGRLVAEVQGRLMTIYHNIGAGVLQGDLLFILTYLPKKFRKSKVQF